MKIEKEYDIKVINDILKDSYSLTNKDKIGMVNISVALAITLIDILNELEEQEKHEKDKIDKSCLDKDGNTKCSTCKWNESEIESCDNGYLPLCCGYDTCFNKWIREKCKYKNECEQMRLSIR